jgi:hypothetical protein
VLAVCGGGFLSAAALETGQLRGRLLVVGLFLVLGGLVIATATAITAFFRWLRDRGSQDNGEQSVDGEESVDKGETGADGRDELEEEIQRARKENEEIAAKFSGQKPKPADSSDGLDPR